MAMIYIILVISVFCIHSIKSDALAAFGDKFDLNITELRRVAPTMKQDSPSASFPEDAEFMITKEIRQAFDRFVKYKKEHGTDSEKTYYKDKKGSDIIVKCILNRAIVFMGPKDMTVLRGSGEASYPPWPYIGKDVWENEESAEKKERLINEYFHNNANKKMAKNWEMGTLEHGAWEIGADYRKFLLTWFNINNYLSYDEMQLSALLLVWAQTRFFNNGGRFNKGKINGDLSETSYFGVMVGAVGPRFERPNVMDNVLYINNSDHDPNMAKIIFGKELYEKSIRRTETWQIKDTGVYVSVYVDLLQLRYKMTYKAYLTRVIQYQQVYFRVTGKNITSYISLTGLGAGVWSINNAEQSKMIAVVIAEILDEFEAGGITLSNVFAVIDFVYFGDPSAQAFADACKATSTGQFKEIQKADVHLGNSIAKYKYYRINILFSTNNPSSDKRSASSSHKIFVWVLYAWDGNALTGNELWLTCSSNNPQKGQHGNNTGWLHASGDPAAAVSSFIWYLQNPLMNPKLSERVRIIDTNCVTCKYVSETLPTPIVDVSRSSRDNRRLITDNKESNDSTYRVSSFRIVVIMLLSLLASMFIAYYLFNY